MMTRSLAAVSPRLHHLIYVLRTMSWMVDPRRCGSQSNRPIDRPIFLLGTQGGGLTLLSRMLRRHSAVICGGGGSRYWTSADEIQNIYGAILPAELTGLRYKAPPHPEFPVPRSWTYAVGELLPQYRKRAADATPELEQALRQIIQFSAARHAVRGQSYRFLDKSQTTSVRVGLFNQLLKESNPRFVLVPRDPYVSVFRAASGKAADMRRLSENMPWERRVDVCAEHYANSMLATFEDCDRDGIELHVIQFERLLEQPRESLQSVCEFVGLEYCDSLLPGPADQLPLGSRFLDRWYPLRPGVNDRYDSIIDDVSIEAVNRQCGTLTTRLGYDLRELSDGRPSRAA